MSPLDSAFWALEDRHASLHVAGVAVFEGPAPTLPEIRTMYRRAVTREPALRRRMRSVPLNLGRPVWVDEAKVDLDYHVRATALPEPGGAVELDALLGRLMSAHLDPDRPLWEVWFVQGLADGRWALITKLHHSAVDGISGTSMYARIFDTDPHAQHHRSARWLPAKSPGPVRLVSDALAGQARAAGRLTGQMARLSTRPWRLASAGANVARGAVGYGQAVLRPVAPSQLRGPLSAPRRYATASVGLPDVHQVRSALGGTVNDVVVALATAGLRDLLLARGDEVRPRSVRALIPVSTRPAFDETSDNQVTALLADLPVEFSDPLVRYREVHVRLAQLKDSHEADAGAALTSAGRYVPAPLLAAGLRLAARAPQRVISTVVTNVPGPVTPLYVLGRRMVALYPCVPIADRIRTGIAVTSYDGRLFFGVTGDRESVPDVDVVATAIERELADLTALAKER